MSLLHVTVSSKTTVRWQYLTRISHWSLLSFPSLATLVLATFELEWRDWNSSHFASVSLRPTWLWPPTSSCEACVCDCVWDGRVKSVKSNSEPCVSAPNRSVSSPVSRKVSAWELGPYASTLIFTSLKVRLTFCPIMFLAAEAHFISQTFMGFKDISVNSLRDSTHFDTPFRARVDYVISRQVLKFRWPAGVSAHDSLA